jgi:hypothetical protein
MHDLSNPREAMGATREPTAPVARQSGPSDGAFWRTYLNSVLSRPIIKRREDGNEIQTIA